MINVDRKTISRNIALNILKTLLFTTSITLIMFYLILRKNDPEDLLSVFTISLITGVSIILSQNSRKFHKNSANYFRLHPLYFLAFNGLFHRINTELLVSLYYRK